MRTYIPLFVALMGLAPSVQAGVEDIAQEAAMRLQREGTRVETPAQGPFASGTNVEYVDSSVQRGYEVDSRLWCMSEACKSGTGTDRFDALEHVITDPQNRYEITISDLGANGFKANEGSLEKDEIIIKDKREGGLEVSITFDGNTASLFIPVGQDTYVHPDRSTILNAAPFLDKKYKNLLTWLQNPDEKTPFNEANSRRLLEWLDDLKAEYSSSEYSNSLRSCNSSQ
ncbi:hypothetical protein GOV07_04540 [Candidatus Woesearchaeota archaeon]|nr:hypothetical protein [Candidatus Woesearchaeota archaeon]